MEMPVFSNGWVTKLKRRHNIKSRYRHSEAGAIDDAAIQEQLVACQIAVRAAHPCDVYNCDETGLFWKATPNRGSTAEALAGMKDQKVRITAHFCCNADGSDKLPLWIIGHADRPRCFGAASVNINNLNMHWRNNGRAWMTTTIMIDWLRWFDKRMEGRKVLLLMDTFSAHTAAVNVLRGDLSNTVICWLPATSTSRTQPLDQGIIHTTKIYYRSSWMQYMLDEYERGANPLQTTNVLKTIRWLIQAWNQITTTTIISCWRKSQLTAAPSQTIVTEAVQPTQPEEAQSEALQLIRRLHEAGRISAALSISDLLHPLHAEETVIDADVSNEQDVMEGIVAQFIPQEDEESDDEIECIPKISMTHAVRCIQTLRLFLEQQEEHEEENIQNIRSLEALERCVNLQRRHTP